MKPLWKKYGIWDNSRDFACAAAYWAWLTTLERHNWHGSMFNRWLKCTDMDSHNCAKCPMRMR